MSDSSTLCNSSDKSETRSICTADGFWHAMHLYIRDMPASPTQRQKLTDLVNITKSHWESIVSEKPTHDSLSTASSPGSIMPVERDSEAFDPSDRRDMLIALSEDIQWGGLFTSSPLSRPFPRVINLSKAYIFSASIGHKLPFKKPISACFGVAQEAPVSLIRTPGRRVRALQVGYCSQFDVAVFFGADGQIYLVEAEAVERPGREGEVQIFESDEVMNSDWTCF